jgi:hypothetical protein
MRRWIIVLVVLLGGCFNSSLTQEQIKNLAKVCLENDLRLVIHRDEIRCFGQER